jgi:hypothetical protein
MRSARLFVVGLLSSVLVAAGLVAAAVPAGAVAAKYRATETQTYKVEVLGQLYATQSNGVAYYYCAVGIFVPFNDAQGYDAVKGDLAIDGTPTSVPLGDPPYDDDATTGGLFFKPVYGQHHVRVLPWKEFNASGPVDANQQCSQLRDDTDAVTSDTVTVTYQAVGSCGKAIGKEAKAAKAVKKAKKKVKHASGPALPQAQAALDRAKHKLVRAKQKIIRLCAVVRVATTG